MTDSKLPSYDLRFKVSKGQEHAWSKELLSFPCEEDSIFWFIQHPGCYVGKQNERHQLFLIPVLIQGMD